MSEEGGDDSPPRPKRKIKKVVIVSSSSGSDSDESVGIAGTRRKRLRVISDGEASDSSGSSVVCAGTRRRKILPKLRDSETESDSSGWGSDHSAAAKSTNSMAKPASGFASDSSEGNSDKCSICLLRFKDQEIGTPENCEHIFCLDCITEWSKNVNTCPVDRMTFNSIVVRACVGGRVVRTEQVKVNVRRSSVDALITEQSEIVCEVCGSTEDEETLLLCDGCDHGYHMRCLTPPLSEIPQDQWHCPNCVSGNVSFNRDNDFLDNIPLSEVEDLIDDIGHDGLRTSDPRPSPLRLPRIVYRSPRIASRDQPSTSSGRRSNSVHINEVPTTSRAARRERAAVPAVMRRRTATKRRKYKRRRTKTVIIEYEIQGNGKFPITKKVKRKIKRRRVKKRQPRTAARRTYVRASVRAKLETLRANESLALSQAANASRSVQQLSVRHKRAGVPVLNIFGNPNELDYFSEEDNAISEEASTAVATRSTSNIFSAYRQTRRKMVTIPSPSYASSAPDILSNILESQTLLHSKQSVITVSVDGNVDYKLQTIQRKQEKSNLQSNKEEKIDLSRANEAVKNAPLYPGQNRGSGGGGWGGGYRGNYHRDQNSNNFNNRSSNYDNNNYGGGYQNRQGNNYSNNNNNNYQNNTMRHDETEYYDNFPRRSQQYSHNEDSHFDRSRRPVENRGNNYPNHQRSNDQNQGRYSLGQSWSPFGGAPTHAPRHEVPPTQSRHSFGGFENPVDMRMGQMSQTPQVIERPSVDMFPGIGAPRQEKPQPQSYQSLPEPPQAYQPLSQPPVFNFQKLELERSEDEKSDSGLIIDTEKYDPTEPTNDDDSGDDDGVSAPVVEFTAVAPPSPPPLPPQPPLPPPPAVQSILAGIDTSAMNVPSNILDTAVRQVLKEHRNLISSPSMETHNNRSDDDTDGDCPNFSIYSATSVHIANNTSLIDDIVTEPLQDNLEDLVQEDDETPPSTSPVIPPDIINIETKSEFIKTPSKPYPNFDSMERKKTEEEYKEKVSKRCPITTNTRNPIKIKLNTPSLIKRQVTLYDEEENSVEVEADDKPDRASETHEQKSSGIASPVGKVDEDPGSAPDTCSSKVESTAENSASSSPSRQNQNKSLEPIKKFSSESFQIVDVNKNDTENNKDLVEVQDEHLNEVSDTGKLRETTEDASDNNEDLEDNNEDEGGIDDPEIEIAIKSHSPSIDLDSTKVDDNVEKMTESISETEDERSYTPCLDENKSNKDASLEMEKDKGLEGLDTEMISEEEGNEMFSENERQPSETSRVSPPMQPAGSEEGEISDKKEKKESKKSVRDDTKKKKKKDSKKEGKDKAKNKKKNEISFKKLSKSGKERNYRERDKDEKKGDRERRDSGENESRNRRRKEKRKDLERYDVRTIVTEKRRKQKDPFGRDISPREHSPSLSPPPRSPSPARRRSPSLRRSQSRLRRTPSGGRRSISRNRRSISRPRRSLSRIHRSLSRPRRSLSRVRRSISRSRRSISRTRRSISKVRQSPSRRSISRGRGRSPVRKSVPRRITPVRGRSPSRPRGSPIRARRSPPRRSGTPRLSPRRRSPTRRKRRRSTSRAAARRRSASGSPQRRTGKKKKRVRSARGAIDSSVDRKRKRSSSHQLEREPSPPSRAPSLRPPSPRTPPPGPVILPSEEERRTRRRRVPERPRRRARELAGPSKEVFTSGDNILVSVSFKDQERGEEGERRRRRESRRERRRRRRAATAPETEVAKPVAIIDLDRSPFRELTPSPKNVIVLSDSDHGERENNEVVVSAPIAAEPQPEPAPPSLGPKTPPEPVTTEVVPESGERPPEPDAEPGSETHSPDAYDPFEPTRSPSVSPASASVAPAAPPSPPRALITLEGAQRSNMSADEVLDRRPITPVEKVLALLQSTREVSPEGVAGAAEPEAPPVMATAPRIVLPSPTRSLPKLFPGKPSPIKSNPVKPMQALRLPRLPALPSDGGASPYSPGSSDFGELFEPPTRRSRGSGKRVNRKKASKTHVGVKVDEDNLKILDDLPSSAVEMQVKSKFLKKLNRQERVVEEVKLVLKPHYNKKRVNKEEYKDILRRAVPKICHNKSGEINPTKIQALVEAYVKKVRKKNKLGVVS